MNKKKEKGFVLVFVIAVVAALSLMTAAMNFYYDSALKSVTRNSVYQQIKLASESGVQAGKNWVLTTLNKDQFSLLDIQNNFRVQNADNQCLNRHGYTDASKDILFSKRIVGNLGEDDAKFQGITYEVFVQRFADNIGSIFFSGTGIKGTDRVNRSSAYVEDFKDFPNTQFTIEMWLRNMHEDDDIYDMHLFEWGRRYDLVFKVLKNGSGTYADHSFSPRLGEVVLDSGGDVGDPVRREWTHMALVWDGGNSAGNVKIYQNGNLTGTFNADIGPRTSNGYTNNDDELPSEDIYPLIIGDGQAGFLLPGDTIAIAPARGDAGDDDFIYQGKPWLGNVAEFRLWNVSRSQTDIANNNRKRITGAEPGLVSYYKFNEGSGNAANDYSTTRAADRINNLTISGIATQGTVWSNEMAKYPLEVDHGIVANINVPPGEDIAYYRILSCGRGSEGQLVPLESIVSAPVVQGGVGDGAIAINQSELTFTDPGFSPLRAEFNFYEDGSENSIYLNGEDSIVCCTSMPSGWTKTQSFTNNASPLILTPPAGALSANAINTALANIFYQNCSKEHICSAAPETYTPGVRRIKARLIYTNAAFNQTIGITKNLAARNKVILTPTSWKMQ